MTRRERSGFLCPTVVGEDEKEERRSRSLSEKKEAAEVVDDGEEGSPRSSATEKEATRCLSLCAVADNNRDPSWITKTSFVVLTINSGLAMYRAREDAASVLFVAGSYLLLPAASL
ncbi:hypothetical protein PR202_ga18156 [Eleusine coracana subsp. coracana]|uniref:Uncharacterized protein n=1 Tax=Eleusine coracana subsp. coracana TaxID=191504 RepID=A0AAV5CQQ3_ELECO|nr:hypothetical protein PR202_ga18156 [Eleusine coracana subsp. coracana]